MTEYCKKLVFWCTCWK